MGHPSRDREARLRRGELAKDSGCNIETVRFYERAGLLPAPPRSAAGHRLYSQEHLRRLVFIRRSRDLGFTLEEVRGLLAMVDGGYTCGEVQALTLTHLGNIREKIADLRRLEQSLTNVASQCEGGAVPKCPVIDVLFDQID
jgi:MerR family mercuric resistance operon transcriptional regulator